MLVKIKKLKKYMPTPLDLLVPWEAQTGEFRLKM